MKIISFYLPQFHCIPENDAWWGKGFTEWVNMKKAKPLFEGHYQPRIPLDHNYYNLLDDKTIEWQSAIAEEYGIYGFCFYHYWFGGKLLLEKPIELYRNNSNCKTHYCICWANEDWTNQWTTEEPKVLIAETYGDKEEWKKHFEYFLPYFKDERYIRVDGKPVLVFLSPEKIKNLIPMLDYWDELAKKEGFDGITYMSQGTNFRLSGSQKAKERLDYFIDYQPQYAYSAMKQGKHALLRKLKRKISNASQKYFNIDPFVFLEKSGGNDGPAIYDYDDIWQRILNQTPESSKVIPGAFVDWDNTPRKERRGFVINGASPEKFEKYLRAQIDRAEDIYDKDMIFLFAWNEWAEGGYMEPDERFGYGYLEAVKKALH